jgi:hypothetical protein
MQSRLGGWGLFVRRYAHQAINIPTLMTWLAVTCIQWVNAVLIKIRILKAQITVATTSKLHNDYLTHTCGEEQRCSLKTPF